MTDGETGRLVPPVDPAALAAALLACLTDPPLLMAMGRAARRRAEESFALATAVAAYELLYLGLLCGTRWLAPAGPAVSD